MRVFVSHAEQDGALAVDLAAHLSRAGYTISYPASSLARGENWNVEVGRALEDSDAMVVLVSPQSASSDALRQQIDYALGSEKYEGKLIPVFVGRPKKYPWIFNHLPSIKFSGGSAQGVGKICQLLQPSDDLIPAG